MMLADCFFYLPQMEKISVTRVCLKLARNSLVSLFTSGRDFLRAYETVRNCLAYWFLPVGSTRSCSSYMGVTGSTGKGLASPFTVAPTGIGTTGNKSPDILSDS